MLLNGAGLLGLQMRQQRLLVAVAEGRGVKLAGLGSSAITRSRLESTSRPSATIASVMRSTGWQSHTVRAFLAAVVRKKLGLTLESEKTDGERVYRIVAGKTSADATSVPSA